MRMGGEGGRTRRDSECGSTRKVLPRVGIFKSPATKKEGSEMWKDKDWWVWRAIGCVMGEGGEMRGVEKAKESAEEGAGEGAGEVGRHNRGWVVGKEEWRRRRRVQGRVQRRVHGRVRGRRVDTMGGG